MAMISDFIYGYDPFAMAEKWLRQFLSVYHEVSFRYIDMVNGIVKGISLIDNNFDNITIDNNGWDVIGMVNGIS